MVKEEISDDTRKMWLVLLVVTIGTFVVSLDSSIVNIAIPKMMRVFDISTSRIEWIVTGYMLTLGVVMPLTGYLSHRFGEKRIYVTALVLFTGSSLMCGAAGSFYLILLARIFQAVGGGLLMPVGMSMLYKSVPLERRGLMLGVYGISVMSAPTFGPAIGGYLVQYVSWRMIFFINLPFGALGIILAVSLLAGAPAETGKRLDVVGAVTSVIGVTSLLYALSRVSDIGWCSFEVLGLLAVAAVSLLLFTLFEIRHSDPLLELKLLRSARFSLSLVVLSLTTIAMYGIMFLMPIYLQSLRGYDALKAGLILLPQALISGLTMLVGGRLFDQYGAKRIAIPGLLVLAVSVWMFARLHLDTPMGIIIAISAVSAVGMGLVMMPVQNGGMNSVPKELLPKASALFRTVIQASGSFGIAVLTSVLQWRQSVHVTKSSTEIHSGYEKLNQILHSMNDTFMVSVLMIILAASVALFLPDRVLHEKPKS